MYEPLKAWSDFTAYYWYISGIIFNKLNPFANMTPVRTSIGGSDKYCNDIVLVSNGYLP